MASYIDNPSKLDWAMSFQRTGTFPLDRSSMFASLVDAQNYAKGDGSDSRALGGTSYVGQVIAFMRMMLLRSIRSMLIVLWVKLVRPLMVMRSPFI